MELNHALFASFKSDFSDITAQVCLGYHLDLYTVPQVPLSNVTYLHLFNEQRYAFQIDTPHKIVSLPDGAYLALPNIFSLEDQKMVHINKFTSEWLSKLPLSSFTLNSLNQSYYLTFNELNIFTDSFYIYLPLYFNFNAEIHVYGYPSLIIPYSIVLVEFISSYGQNSIVTFRQIDENDHRLLFDPTLPPFVKSAVELVARIDLTDKYDDEGNLV